MKFAYLTGLVAKKSLMRFKMMIYRKARGNAITIIENIFDFDPDLQNAALNKAIYVIIFQESESLRGNIQKICESFEDGVYDLNTDIKPQVERITEQEKECKRVLKIMKEELMRKLQEFASPAEGSEGSLIENYRWFFERECIIYTNLNLFKFDHSWFKGLCWCPVNKRNIVDESITELRQRKKVLCSNLKEVPNSNLEPPTLFRTNDLIKPFSEIAETYGIPKYKEINPCDITDIRGAGKKRFFDASRCGPKRF